MSISTYFKPNSHQNSPEILGVNKELSKREINSGLLQNPKGFPQQWF
jgi:hypothetical protein